MEYLVWILVGAALIWILLVKRSSMVAEDQAQAWIKQGARIIDVRNPEEFAHRQLPGAINIPLGRIQDEIGQAVPNKDQILLMHCAAGGRSALAVRKLKNLGYARAYNLGSLSRAERIVKLAQSSA